MNKLRYSDEKHEVFSTNAYIRIERIDNREALEDVFKHVNSFIATSIKDSEIFVERLCEHEEHSTSANKRHLFGAILTFLLDEERGKDEVERIVDSIVEKYQNLPYYSWTHTEGHGFYLNIYLSERQYFEFPVIYIKKAAKDIYKSKLTHKYCQPSDPNAEVVTRKGDVISETMTYFSDKTDLFRGTRYDFIDKMNALKDWFIDLLHELFDTVVTEGISFNQHKLKDLEQTKRCSADLWNRTFRKMSDSYNNAITGIKLMHLDYDKALHELIKVYDAYSALITRDVFVLNNKGHKYRYSLVPDEEVEQTIEATKALERKFNTTLGNSMNRIIEAS